MNSLSEKELFVRHQSTAKLDQFFQLRPITDVAREGAEVLYLTGLTPEALYTSYHDLLEVMPWLYNQGARTWCDVGCGVGRTCLMWTWLYNDTKAFGIELVPERLEEARSATRTQTDQRNFWIEADFSSPNKPLPDADVYFLYLATGPQLDSLLKKLKNRHSSSFVVVIESHGDLKPRLQWEAWWLAPTANRFSLTSHRHDPWIQIYRTRPDHPVLALEEAWEARTGLMPNELALHPSPMGYLLSKSMQLNWELVIEEDGEMWTMDTLGLTWFDPYSLQGSSPPRQVSWAKSKIGLRRLPTDQPYQQWANWRRMGATVSYLSSEGHEAKNVKIRKLILNPLPMIEFSSGIRLPWKSLLKLEIEQ